MTSSNAAVQKVVFLSGEFDFVALRSGIYLFIDETSLIKDLPIRTSQSTS